MKIGIYDPYLDTLGGGERYMLTIAQCLSSENDVEVFWGNAEILEKAQIKFGLDLKKVKTTENVFSKKSFKIIRFLKTLKYDIIIYLSDGSMPLLPTKKTFIHFQSPITSEKASARTKAKLKTSKGIIVNSRYTKKFIDSTFGRDSTVIYPPVDVYKFKKNPKKKNTILTVGRYSKVSKGDFKKHTEMIKAFKKIIDNNIKNWKFKMVISTLPQDKQEVEELKKQIEKYPIQIYTQATDRQITQMYEEAKIYWHAAGYGEDLDKSPELAEHFGISVVEAMAAGAVPIVYKAGGLREIVKDKDTGILWTHLPEFIDHTTELIKNEDKMNKYASRARKETEYYSNERFCEEIKKLLQ